MACNPSTREAKEGEYELRSACAIEQDPVPHPPPKSYLHPREEVQMYLLVTPKEAGTKD